jgi:hypothetical protein
MNETPFAKFWLPPVQQTEQHLFSSIGNFRFWPISVVDTTWTDVCF